MTDNTQTEVRAQKPDNLADQIAAAGRRLELQDPDRELPPLGRWINRIVEAAGALVLCTIVAVIFANAVARYLFNTSFLWAEELVLLLVPWLAMTGVFLSVRRGTMIRIDYFFERLPQSLRRPISTAGYAVSIAVLVFLGWVSLDFLKLFGGDTSIYLGIRSGWSTSALVFGAFGAALAFLVGLHQEWRKEREGAQQ